MQVNRDFSLVMLCIHLHDIYCAVLSQSGVKLMRDKRYLVYPPPGEYAPSKVQLILGLGLPMEVDVSMIIGYVMKLNYNLPYNASHLSDPYVRYDRSINHHIEFDGNDASTPTTKEVSLLSRWECYEILESVFKPMGKVCLLKSICEAAAVPFRHSHTLTAHLAHVFLTPSTTFEPLRNAFDQEYQAAEIAGQKDVSNCDNLFSECPESILEYFTEIFE